MTKENEKFLKTVKTRLIWLTLGLLISLSVSKYINRFETLLQQNILVITFIPMIVYLADAIGTQMESIIIREMAERRHFILSKFFRKQLSIAVILGFILGTLAYFTSFFIYKDHRISIVLATAIVFSAFSAVVTGTLIPYLFWKLHKDPAEASGPIATVIQDTLSVVIYFSVFTMFY
jgi:magnesium transporter